MSGAENTSACFSVRDGCPFSESVMPPSPPNAGAGRVRAAIGRIAAQRRRCRRWGRGYFFLALDFLGALMMEATFEVLWLPDLSVATSVIW
jgi:hypothetical protein